MAFITLDKITDKAIKTALTDADGHVQTYMDNLRTANKSLYVAMQDAYRLSQIYDKVALHKAAREIEVKLQTLATGELAAVKLVFRNADTSKASAYSAVLVKGAALKISVDGFAKWIEDNKGIEAIRRADYEELSKQNKADKTAAIAKADRAMKGERVDAFVIPRPEDSILTLPVHSDSKKAVWFVTERANGDFEVIAVQTGKGAVDAMTKRVGEALANPANVKDFKVILKPAKPNTDKQDAAKDRLAGKSE
ncbi:hypothetical protein AMK06_CH03363 [Rhizobium sp. N541]|uniref:hypothetical protein n=1 Tax=unclassified Rhizobium TaxID=2613769 RepID=UPI0007EE28DD|nr:MULTISPECIES: hypothetical protein [unclassified Rhizobium]ANM18237.1 hypothetical protein AMK06_CH03363 [Rhizobium sp. N541]ANM24623.1 hypothetical protein AMK07_CH03361 [Rhizobium sp. N941]